MWRTLFVVGVLLSLPGCGNDNAERCEEALCANKAGRAACVDLARDPQHCGACGDSCADAEACQSGQCVVVCDDGEARCGGACVGLGSSVAHCGACGKRCGEGEFCVDGSCSDEAACEGDDCECGAGKTRCGDKCVALDRNESHCGECDAACESDQECQAGECGCPAGTESCWFECLDTSEDSFNCGACGEICSHGMACSSGKCECPTGLTFCDGTCVDVSRSRLHCGSCREPCQGRDVCLSGMCVQEDDSCVGVATDLDLVRLTLSQGVEIELAAGASAVPRAVRAVEVVQGRRAHLRAFVEPGASALEREFSARVTVKNGASSEIFSRRLILAEASTQADLSSTFNIDLPPDVVGPDTEYSVELLNCGASGSGVVGVHRFPTGLGMVALDAIASSAIKVVIVPVRHDGRLPDTSEDVLEVYAREIERQFPTVDVEITVEDPIKSAEKGIIPDLGVILDQITDKRWDDGAADDLYYFGLVDPAPSLAEYCDGGCTTGIAWWLEGTGLWARQHRAGVGIGFGTFGANTMAHEIGHNLGRDHAPCAVKGDKEFPYHRAKIGVWGYDALSGTLKDPSTFHDLMSYCEPNWISDYTYRGIHERLRKTGGLELTRETGSERTWASLLVTSSGARWVRPTRLRGAPSSRSEIGVVYDVFGEPLLEVEVHRLTISDDGGYKLLVPPKEPGWFAVGPWGSRAVAYE